MLTISRFLCEEKCKDIVTDRKNPRFSFAVESDLQDLTLKEAFIEVNGTTLQVTDQRNISYEGPALRPYTDYRAYLSVTDSAGEKAEKSLTFRTGRMGEPFQADWISDASYQFTEKKISPLPMVFRKEIIVKKPVKSAGIYATALGIYQILLDGERVSEDYFTPGFTSYKTNLQYQFLDVTERLRKDSEKAGDSKGSHWIYVPVSGGWAVGSFVYTRKNRVSGKRQAFLCEIRIDYMDGSSELIGSGTDWEVSMDGPMKMADLYDGETFDARITPEKMTWHRASIEKTDVSRHPEAAYGAPVRAHERMKAELIAQKEDSIYDFGQNFAGVVELNIRKAQEGQKIVVRHAELLHPDGSLNTDFLRTAKAELTYICKEGAQTFSPHFTYMGFRYISVSGISPEDVEVAAFAIYSDVSLTGAFHSSDPRLNQLQSNILWGARSNFVEVPTDCPQRDERMGWTGDIAVFAPTALWNFTMTSFLEKWLKDMRAEQLSSGGIPNTIPSCGFHFPDTMPTMAVDFWGDASVLVPWAVYQATGNTRILSENFEMMKKYVKACKWWAGLFSVGIHRYLWNTPAVLHFGDWVAPDVPQMSQWQKRSKWTATASLAHTADLLSKIAEILGEKREAAYFRKISQKASEAYEKILMEPNGKLKEEFQTAYVLPVHFNMISGERKAGAVKALDELVKKNHYRIGTGFPGTPYILFALADNGCVDTAVKMLFNEECPSWLYEVKMGATTIWERWDGLDENGNCPIGDDGTDIMISYNHYASGAVGDFLYRRILGIEPKEAGYRTFTVSPLSGSGLTEAEGTVDTPYGPIHCKWTLKKEGAMSVDLKVPVGTRAEVKLPGKEPLILGSGSHTIS